jgi:hypothetical protein
MLPQPKARAFKSSFAWQMTSSDGCRATGIARTHLERIMTKAGHKPWPRLLQKLRPSCEADWVEKHPAHVVAPWLRHSPKVAAQHYLMSR